MATISDGIVNPKVFKKERIKLLWVLKEANGGKGKIDWDLCEFLRFRSKEDEGLFGYKKWKSTWGLVCKVSWGILESTKTFEKINNYDCDLLAKVLDRIAVINVKKIAGGSSVKYKNFNRHIDVPQVNRVVAKLANVC